MKKTLIINIGNTIIHFEEDAYEALTGYLNGIKAHFASTADNFEIVTDIENRIAELLREILISQKKQVIELQDVQEVMARMGRISDFEQEDSQQAEGSHFSGYANYKTLYRDVEEAKLAGVCAGLSHYLNIDVAWVRVFALISITFGGAGILAYIIMWAVIPPAITRADRMAMKGEAADLQGFKRSFEEDLAAFKAQVKNANEQFQPYVKRTGGAMASAAGSVSRFIESTAKVFFKFIAVVIIATGVCMMLALLISLAVVFGIWDSNPFEYFPFTIINNGDQESLLFAAFITCFIPVLAMVLFSIRVAFSKRAINRTLSYALLTIWLCGVGFTTYYITHIFAEFKENAELTQTVALKPFQEYTLVIDETMFGDHTNFMGMGDRFDYRDANGRTLVYDGDHPFRVPRNVYIDIERSEEGVMLTQNYEANGRDFRTAVRNAQQIDYKFMQSEDKLTFSPVATIKQAGNWRAQEVHLILKVPVGTVLHVSDELNPYLSYYSWNCRGEKLDFTDWVMTKDGLKCKNERSNNENE